MTADPATRRWRLRALSPLDGRYGAQMEQYAATFSEGALIRERFAVEVAWLEQLSALPELGELGPISEPHRACLDAWVEGFGEAEAMAVKDIEGRTNHDVKAVEYYLKGRLTKELGWSAAHAEFAHFGATSEDVNNLAYAKMARSGLAGAWLPAAKGLVDEVRALALEHAGLPMLARTHGQPATPTTLGKELAVFVARWERQLEAVRDVRILGKWGGATGTLAAQAVSCPELDWLDVARAFVESLGFEWSPLTTQVEPHDWIAELFDAMSRFGTILIDFCRDMWAYVEPGLPSPEGRRGGGRELDDAPQGQPDRLRERGSQRRCSGRPVASPVGEAPCVALAAGSFRFFRSAQYGQCFWVLGPGHCLCATRGWAVSSRTLLFWPLTWTAPGKFLPRHCRP